MLYKDFNLNYVYTCIFSNNKYVILKIIFYKNYYDNSIKNYERMNKVR